MEYKNLGRTGVKISSIALGSDDFGDGVLDGSVSISGASEVYPGGSLDFSFDEDEEDAEAAGRSEGEEEDEKAGCGRDAA